MKARTYSKRVLSVVLGAVVILSSMVFAVNTNVASAAAGEYTLVFTYNVTDDADKQGNIQDSYWKITYKTNNGTGSEGTYTYSLKDNWQLALEGKNTKTISVTVPGWPTSVYYYHDATWTDGIHYTMTNISVGGSTKVTAWSGSQKIESGGFGNSEASGSLTLTADVPKISSVSGAAYEKSSVTAPKPNGANVTNKIKTSSIKAWDQYGVAIVNPSYTYVPTATAGVNFDNTTSTVTSFANIETEPYYKDVYTEVRASFNNVTVKDTVSFRVDNCLLNYAFKNYNGDTITSGTLTYGKIPQEPTAPAREPDAAYHYVYNGWDRSVTNLTDDTVYTAQFASVAHNFGTPAVTNPDCENDGESVSTCADCAYVKRETLPKLGHSYNLVTSSPADGVDGYSYFVCDVCGKSFNFIGANTPGDETDTETAKANGKVPAPFFNNCSKMQSNGQFYDYTKRGAALLVGQRYSLTQQMRFTASMQIPEGATVEEVGYVYSLSNYVATIDFVQGANRVYTQPCTNYTDHGDGILTYNLLIDIKRDNWKKLYAARAYVTYNYKGVSYTVYDKDYASKSVYKVATAVVNSTTESAIAKAYCQEKIIDYLEA